MVFKVFIESIEDFLVLRSRGIGGPAALISDDLRLTRILIRGYVGNEQLDDTTVLNPERRILLGDLCLKRIATDSPDEPVINRFNRHGADQIELTFRVLFGVVFLNSAKNGAGFAADHKDVEYANSQLNVIDAHEGIYNLTIRNSEIGARGIEVLGFGDLKIIDSTINSNELMHLKEDYGSSWDGTIYVSNSTLRYKGKYGLALVSFSTEPDGDAVHDYGYDLVYPNVIIENLTIDNQDNLDRSDLWIIPDWNRATNPYISDTYFDNNIFINGISFINNNHFDNPGMMLFVNNIDKLKGNYVITDLKMQNAEGDFTHAFNVGESMSSNSDVTLTINKPNSFANRLTVYRNDEVVVDNVEINNTYSNTFKEDGDYKMLLTSIYDGYNRDGIKEYEFTIDKSSNPVTPPDDDDDDDNDVIPEPREDENYIPKVPNTGVSSIGTTVSSTFTIVLVIIVCRILIRFSHKKVDFDSIK